MNASYDVGRELFADINKAFIAEHPGVAIDQSHAGASAQARAVADGLGADVVTFNQVTDVDFLVKKGLVSADWRKGFPHNASPFYSLPSFLVRAGNPKHIRDWNDLVRDDVQVIFPNPRTSGNARYTYLAATAYAKEAFKGDDAKVKEFITKLFNNVPIFDTGGRAATTTFVQHEIGDVLITFESETRGIRKEYGDDKFEQVTPSVSLLAEFPVAIVDKVAHEHGSRDLAKTYLDFLYSPEGQDIARPQWPAGARRGGRRQIQGRLPGRPPGDGGGHLRRLGQGAERAFRGWRPARPGLRQPITPTEETRSRLCRLSSYLEPASPCRRNRRGQCEKRYEESTRLCLNLC